MSYSPVEIKQKRILLIGGGVGIAPIYPQAKWLFQAGAYVEVIIAHTKSIFFFIDELKRFLINFITTDDNSSKTTGLVTDVLTRLLEQGENYDEILP